MIDFACPSCRKQFNVADEHGGRKVKCPKCGTMLTIPRSLADHLAAREPPAPTQPASPTKPMAGGKPPKPPADDTHDGPIFGPPHAEEEEMIDLTPMVDIVFFLLIFFLVTSAQTIQASLEVPPPDPQQGSSQGRVSMEALEKNDDYIVARIDKDNTVWVNESEAPSRQEVILKFRDARDNGASSLVVMASGDCRHETVVMVLDAGTSAGIENVRLANIGEDDL